MAQKASISAINERLARKIRREAKENPDSPYANRFVGITNGEIVVIADSLDAMVRRLQKIEPDPKKCYFVDVSADYDRVEYV